MAWNRNDPDPFEGRRRQLAEKERALAEQRRRLTEQIQASGQTSPNPAARAEPLVWRSEDDGPPVRTVEPTPARKRNLARQTRRDMIVVIGLVILLVVIVVIWLWIAHSHTLAPGA